MSIKNENYDISTNLNNEEVAINNAKKQEKIKIFRALKTGEVISDNLHADVIVDDDGNVVVLDKDGKIDENYDISTNLNNEEVAAINNAKKQEKIKIFRALKTGEVIDDDVEFKVVDGNVVVDRDGENNDNDMKSILANLKKVHLNKDKGKGKSKSKSNSKDMTNILKEKEMESAIFSNSNRYNKRENNDMKSILSNLDRVKKDNDVYDRYLTTDDLKRIIPHLSSDERIKILERHFARGSLRDFEELLLKKLKEHKQNEKEILREFERGFVDEQKDIDMDSHVENNDMKSILDNLNKVTGDSRSNQDKSKWPFSRKQNPSVIKSSEYTEEPATENTDVTVTVNVNNAQDNPLSQLDDYYFSQTTYNMANDKIINESITKSKLDDQFASQTTDNRAILEISISDSDDASSSSSSDDASSDDARIKLPSIPVGTIMDFAGFSPPIGWMICDGRQLKIESYPELYSVIVNKFNEGIINTQTEFKLPSLATMFMKIIKY